MTSSNLCLYFSYHIAKICLERWISSHSLNSGCSSNSISSCMSLIKVQEDSHRMHYLSSTLRVALECKCKSTVVVINCFHFLVWVFSTANITSASQISWTFVGIKNPTLGMQKGLYFSPHLHYLKRSFTVDLCIMVWYAFSANVK